MSSENTKAESTDSNAKVETTEENKGGLLASVTGFFSNVVEKVEGVAIAAKDAVLGDSNAEEKKEEVKEAAAEKKDELVEKANEKKEDLKEKAQDLKADATKKKDELVEKATEKKEQATEKKDEIKSDAADKKDTLLEKAVEIKDTVLEKVSDLKDVVVDKINNIKESVAEGVANAQQATESQDKDTKSKEASKETESKEDSDDEELDEAQKIAKKLGHGPATKVGGMRISQNTTGPHLAKKADGTTHHHSGTAHFEVKHDDHEKAATELALAEKADALKLKEISTAPKESKANPSTYHHEPSKHDEHAKTQPIQPNFQPGNRGTNH